MRTKSTRPKSVLFKRKSWYYQHNWIPHIIGATAIFILNCSRENLSCSRSFLDWWTDKFPNKFLTARSFSYKRSSFSLWKLTRWACCIYKHCMVRNGQGPVTIFFWKPFKIPNRQKYDQSQKLDCKKYWKFGIRQRIPLKINFQSQFC